MSLRPVNVGPARFRVGPWRGSTHIAYLVPVTPARTLRPETLATLRERLRRQSYTAVYTAAVATRERDALARDDFTVHEELHLLRRELRHPIAAPPTRRGDRVRAGRRRDHDAVIELDGLAFGDFWHLDDSGLDEALTATPVSRLRVVRGSGLVGYAVVGRAGAFGYLQRLAVDPAAQGRGIGSGLVVDALRWLRRRRATAALVNTQLDNDRALSLYERHGFERQDENLAVLHRAL